MTFDPSRHMFEYKHRDKKTQQIVITKYLPVDARIAWFRTDFPITGEKTGTIDTVYNPIGEYVVATTEIRVDGKLIASGSATVRKFDMQGSARDIERAETAATGRALARAGYGTMEAGDEFAEGEYLADAPQEAKPTPAPSNGNVQPQAATGLSKEDRAAYVAHLSELGLTWNDVRFDLVPGTELITMNDVTLDTTTLYRRTDEIHAALNKPATPKNGNGTVNPTDDKPTDKQHFTVDKSRVVMTNRNFATPGDETTRELLEENKGEMFYITAIDTHPTVKANRWMATASYQGTSKKNQQMQITLWPEHKRAIERAGYVDEQKKMLMGKVEIPITINWSQGNGWEVESVWLAEPQEEPA